MPIHAERFNRLFALRWRRIADFLKLHYALSRRDEPYWRAQRDAASISPELGGNGDAGHHAVAKSGPGVGANPEVAVLGRVENGVIAHD